MSQTWEQAQGRGVVKLGTTTVHLLGRAYQQQTYSMGGQRVLIRTPGYMVKK